MAANDPAFDVPTPTGTLRGVATFSWDGSAWQPAGRASVGVGTPTGVLRGVAQFPWSGSAWQPAAQASPSVATPSGVLDGVAVYTWSGSAWVPAGGTTTPSTPAGALRGVAAFSWDGTAWQPAGQAGPSVATPYGVLEGVALFNWTGTAWAAAGAPAFNISFMTPGVLDARMTFTRASVGTYFDVTGTMQTATANTPRWDYNSTTHALNGLLIEEARTNLLLNSATLGTQSVTTTAAATTLSFYGTGTVTLTGTSTAGPLTGTGAANRVALTFTPTAGTLTCTVTGSVLNAQLEAGAYATSYIPTTGTSVARSPDSLTMSTTSLLTNAAAFSLMMEMQLIGPGLAIYLQVDDGTQPNRSAMQLNAGISSVNYGEVVSSTVTVPNIGATALTAGTPGKAAFSTIAALHMFSVNGAAPTTNANASGPPPINTLRIGRSVTGTQGAVYARRVQGWARALSAAELQQVTT